MSVKGEEKGKGQEGETPMPLIDLRDRLRSADCAKKFLRIHGTHTHTQKTTHNNAARKKGWNTI